MQRSQGAIKPISHFGTHPIPFTDRSSGTIFTSLRISVSAALIALTLCSCAEMNQAIADAQQAQAQRHEPRSIPVPDGLSESDVLSRAGAPQYVTPTPDGGKILVYEKTTTTTDPSYVIDTTPRAPQCVGNCGNVAVIPQTKSAVVINGNTHESTSVLTITIGPDGKVKSITRRD